MSYTRHQIEDTVSYIIDDAFRMQSSKNQQLIKTSLTDIFIRLTKANPSEIKFALDKKDPFLFSEFFELLNSHDIQFPSTRYVLKRDGQSIADNNGDLTVIVKKPKVTSKHSSHLSEIIEGLRDFHLDRDHVAETFEFEEEPTSQRGRINADGYDRAGYDEEGYDKDGYDRDGYDKDGYDTEGYDVDGYDLQGYDADGYDQNGYSHFGFHKEPSWAVDESLSIGDHHSSDTKAESDFANDLMERKDRAELTYERSNQSKSSRSLYHEAKKMAQVEKKEAAAKSKEQRPFDEPVEPISARRFSSNPEKTLKTTPLLHAFHSHKSKVDQARMSGREHQRTEIQVQKPKMRTV